MKKKVYFILLLLILIIILIMSCKKVNLLGPNNIPPPTAFPNIEDDKEEIPDYPNPTPVPDPPDEVEEKPIEVKPEVVQNGTVFGGYGRRFKFKNDWYVLATNEYEYNPETKMLRQLNKGAVLRIEKDGKTITKIHSLTLGDNLEQTEYWTNLNSKKLIIDANKLYISVGAKGIFTLTEITYDFPNQILGYDNKYGFLKGEDYTIYYKNRESSDIINWIDSSDTMGKTYYLPDTNFNNPGIQGRLGNHTIYGSAVIYINGKLLAKFDRTFIDGNPTGFRDPSAGDYPLGNREYYTVDINKDISDSKNWVTNELPFKENRIFLNFYVGNNKLYVSGGDNVYCKYYDEYKYDDGTIVYNCWSIEGLLGGGLYNGIWSTEDGINWKEEKNVDRSQLKRINNNELHDTVGNYEAPDGTPFEPSYTELNGKYYRTFNSTYPMPPIKEIMETVDRFETNFTVTEDHIKKSGYYQLQVSSVPPDKAQESDWVNIMPNNQTTSSIGWESGGADLFTFNSKIVRLVDYDRQFKLNTQYETALNLSEKYYNLLLNSPMSEFKKYDYYFLYYKAMADMLKIIKDKGNDYFRPDEAVTHYTFELN